ncbi:MAG TPA: hypothetical protein VEW67_09505 [Thermoleophilaceae bacterium]|nr:hypothetical protein [Thermoleophilaceae bacterium]
MTALRRRALRVVAALVLAGALIGAAAPAAGQDGGVSNASVRVEQTGRDGKPRDCSAIERNVRPITGGCVAKLSDAMTVEIMTPFGRMPFATCQLNLIAHFEVDGKVAFEGITVEDIEDSQKYPCPDIRPCHPESDLAPKLWQGEVRARGSDFEIALDICFDTCAGWFEGPLVVRLDRTSAGWRMVADRAEIGESGLEMSGSLRLDGDLRVSRASPRRGI